MQNEHSTFFKVKDQQNQTNKKISLLVIGLDVDTTTQYI